MIVYMYTYTAVILKKYTSYIFHYPCCITANYLDRCASDDIALPFALKVQEFAIIFTPRNNARLRANYLFFAGANSFHSLRSYFDKSPSSSSSSSSSSCDSRYRLSIRGILTDTTEELSDFKVNYIVVSLFLLRVVSLIFVFRSTARGTTVSGVFGVFIGAILEFPLLLASPELVVLIVFVPSFFILNDPSVVIPTSVSRTLLYLTEFWGVAHITLLSASPVHVTAFTTLPVIRTGIKFSHMNMYKLMFVISKFYLFIYNGDAHGESKILK